MTSSPSPTCGSVRKHEELSVDLMRHRPDAPNGTMDVLFSELFLWGRSQDYDWFNFGMAPLAGLDRRAGGAVGAARRIRLPACRALLQLRGTAALQGQVRSPVWTPLFLASPGGMALAPVLLDVTALIAGGFSDIVTKRRGRAA